MTKWMVVAGVALLALAGCDDAWLACATPVPPPDGGYSDAPTEGGTGGGKCTNAADCR